MSNVLVLSRRAAGLICKQNCNTFFYTFLQVLLRQFKCCGSSKESSWTDLQATVNRKQSNQVCIQSGILTGLHRSNQNWISPKKLGPPPLPPTRNASLDSVDGKLKQECAAHKFYLRNKIAPATRTEDLTDSAPAPKIGGRADKF